MKVFSKKNFAQCPNCGEMKPTSATPQQIEDGDWECQDCFDRSGRSQEEERTNEYGQKEISKYDPEYEFLVKLVKLLVKEGVPPQVIRDLANAHQFQTVNDVKQLVDTIFALATETYKIPRGWLDKHLRKGASLKHADLYQGQEESQDMINHAPGYLAYEYGQDKESKKTLNINRVVDILNKKEPRVSRIDINNHSLELTDGSVISFDEAIQRALALDKEGVFSGAQFSTNDVGTNPTMDNGPFSSPEDQGAKPQKQPFPNTNWVSEDDENKDEQPWSNVASSQKRPFSKKAVLPTKFWIAPDGKEFPLGGVHGGWITQNLKTLEHYGIDYKEKSLTQVWNEMIESGWARVTNEPAGTRFIIEVNDLSNIPSYLDDFIAKYYTQGEQITLGNGKGNYVVVADPFPSIQKAINKELLNPVASLKKADLGGRTVNEIVNKTLQGGGVTYNLSQGDMSGTNNFAVSIYPDRSQIVDGGVDFNTVEGYIETNKDLLNDAKNSLGIWSHEGKTYIDVVVTVSDYDEAIDLAKQHNQIAIWDLRNNNEIPTGGTGEVQKTSEEQILSQEDQNQIAADSSPAYVMAVNNYAEVLKLGHGKDRSLQYAVESVANVDKIDPKKLVEIINTYVV